MAWRPGPGHFNGCPQAGSGTPRAWASQQRAASNNIPVVLPASPERLSTEHVLVIEWLDGVSLRAAGPLIEKRGLDRAEPARVLLRSMVFQITEGGS